MFGKLSMENNGESWELSGVANNISEVANGNLEGKNLTQLIETYKGKLVGEKVVARFGNKFPLLFKFIDASEDLSVQLHPNDQLAQERHNSFGKTEMWYIMHAEKDARLIIGFKDSIDKATYLKKLSENKLTEILHVETVSEGDSFFIEPGTVHAIGAGIVLAEIQQTSDITYRIYDWDRPDIDGQLRALHTDQAIAAINYDNTDARLHYKDTFDQVVRLCSTPFFETNKLYLQKQLARDYSALDSFVVYMCIDGAAVIASKNSSEAIKKGETLLIPAIEGNIVINTSGVTILEIYIP
jgi:mannose-6-phosphate isomerase